MVEVLAEFASNQGIRGGRLQGIGAFIDAELGFYDFDRKEYDRFLVEEETEVLALLGNLSILDDRPRVHAHVSLGRRDGSAIGGHLFEGRAGAALELFVLATPEQLSRTQDQAIGLPLLDP